jgi:hypothetical protein
VSFPIVFVALGFSDRESHGQVEAADELLEIDGILASGVDANVKVSLGMLPMQFAEAIFQGLVALAVLHDSQGCRGGRAIGSEERNAMAVTGSVDPDTDAIEQQRSGHG